ncbi:MAG: cyclodeaminase/cyclohydrolase family protein [Bacilli bacterium]|nr:cyclodeaminase/cyclohydrolase family protein [Bacilli bacterium]MBN2876351.1 cyclodeaminase/cyclohydrolase family protein [Bacilli bacterium]
MKLVDMKLESFLHELASNSPAPGGGSVSALAGANAASLVIMVSSLTTNKKKYKALPEQEQNKYQDIICKFEHAKKQFTMYIDEDTESFNQVMAAFGLPKQSEEEIMTRNQAIETATIASIKTPMKVALLALELMREMDIVIQMSNRNTVSDQGVAILLLHSAFLGALMNVKINLPGLSQKELIKEYKDVIMELTDEARDIKDRLLEEVNYLLD